MTTPTRAQAGPHQVLDPRTMGRPVHLVGQFTRQLHDELAELFRTRLNRRYRATFEIGAVSLSQAPSPHSGHRWLTYGSATGRIGFSLDRGVLLCILGYRYGTHDYRALSQAHNPPASPADELTAAAVLEPETATEERLAAMLGQQLVSVLGERIQALHSGGEESAATAARGVAFAEVAATVPLDSGWTLRADIVERTRQIEGAMWFRLDESWITQLLQGLASSRKRSGSTSNAAAAEVEPLPSRLQLKLVARLLQKQMPLGTLLDTRIGDVIPVSLGTSDVLVGDSRLFRASITEHKGKLCLTAFEDVE